MHNLSILIYLYTVKGVFLLNKIIIDSSNRYVLQIKNGTAVFNSNNKEQLLCNGMYLDADAAVTDFGTEIYLVGENSVDCVSMWGRGKSQKCIVQANSGIGKIKSVRVMPSGGYRNLFYCVSKSRKNFLVHHITGNGINEFNTVDCISNRANVSVISDENGNIDVWYINEKREICHTCYIWSQKKYTDKQMFCEDVLNFAVTVLEDGWGIAYIRDGAAYNEVCFKKTSQPDVHILGYGVDYNCLVCIFCSRDGLFVQWSDSKGCAECKSNDNGISFMQGKEIPGIKSEISTVCAYRSKQNSGNRRVDLCISCATRLLHENVITEYSVHSTATI